MSEKYNQSKSGSWLNICEESICVTCSPSGQIIPYKQGSTGRFSHVDEFGRLLVSFPSGTFSVLLEDDLSSDIDGNNDTFILSHIPKFGLDLFWNGQKVFSDNDFTINDKIIKTKFIPKSNNKLLAKYFI